MSQILIDDVATHTSPQKMMQAIDDNFDELYIKADFGVNAKEYGAVGDATTDDTVAIQNAIDSLSSTGGTVYLPKGVYKTTATLKLTSNGVTLRGEGADATKIYCSFAAGNIIELGSYTTNTNGCRLCEIQVLSSIAKTSGAAIKVMNGHQINIDNITLGSNLYYGVQFEAGSFGGGQYLYHMHHFEINSGVNGIIIGEDFSEGGIAQGIYISDGNIANTTGAGILLKHCSGCFFRTIDIFSCQIGVHMNPSEASTGRVVANWFDTIICDSCVAEGWLIQPGSTTGLIQENIFMGCWGASCGTHGMHITNTQADDLISGNSITTGRFINNDAHGILISNKIEALSISNTQCMGNSKLTSNTYSGLTLGDGIDGLTITNGVFGDGGLFSNDQKYGIQFLGTCTNISIVGVNVTGNLTAGIDDYLVGSGNQLKITSCRGHNTEDSGTATITAGNSTVTVTHNLASTPDLNDVSLVHATDPTGSVSGGFFMWVTNMTATTFVINTSAPMVSQCWIYWKVQTR